MNVSKLIELVQCYPHIYDRRSDFKVRRYCVPFDHLTRKAYTQFWKRLCGCSTLNELNKKFPKYPKGKLRAANGNSPSEKNQANIKYPTPAFNLSTVISNVLSTFTDLMRKSLIIADYTQKKNYDFLLQLYRNNNLMRKYNTTQLIQEFIALESDYHRLFGKVDLLPIYKAFQEHIVTRFPNRPSKNNYKITESDVVLIHLYVTLQSKIGTLQNAAKSTLITDMNSFLNIFMENVNLSKENNAYQVIMEIGERYSKEIDTKIEQAYNMINKSVIPKIIKARKEIEASVKHLIVYIKDKLKEMKYEKMKLVKRYNATTPSNVSRKQNELLGKTIKDIKRILPILNLNNIKKNEEAQNALKKTIANVEKRLKPALNTFFRKITWEVVSNAKWKSFASLSLLQRKIDSFVNELTDILQTLAKKNFPCAEMIKNIEAVNSDVKLIIDINKNLLGYRENKKMVNLMVDLQSARYQSSSIRNPEYKKALNKLKVILNTNMILTNYKQTSKQLGQYVFPLAQAFTGKRNIKSFLKKINNPDNILDFATNEINIYKTLLLRSNSFITKYDEIRYRTRFDVGTSVKSFFVWEYTKKNRKQIQELLAGKEVFFRATPDFHLDKNAVKFNKIRLALIDNENQHYLDRILVNFKIIMVHTGENDYICNNKSYVINTPKVTFQYSFGNDSFKKPLFRNAVYDKLVGGNYQLSPFTLWKFQLVNISTRAGYKELKTFDHEAFNVHLVGDGEYYENNSQVCGNDLDEYYEPLIQSEKKKKPCIYGVPYAEDHISAI